MVAKPLCPLYKNIIKPLDRARYPELRYFICILSSIGGYIVTLQFENIYVQLALGGLAFIFSYIILSFLFNVEEIKIIQRKVSQIWHF